MDIQDIHDLIIEYGQLADECCRPLSIEEIINSRISDRLRAIELLNSKQTLINMLIRDAFISDIEWV